MTSLNYIQSDCFNFISLEVSVMLFIPHSYETLQKFVDKELLRVGVYLERALNWGEAHALAILALHAFDVTSADAEIQRNRCLCVTFIVFQL